MGVSEEGRREGGGGRERRREGEGEWGRVGGRGEQLR